MAKNVSVPQSRISDSRTMGCPSLSSPSRSSTWSVWLITSTRWRDSVTPQNTLPMPTSRSQAGAACSQLSSRRSTCWRRSSLESRRAIGATVRLFLPSGQS